MLLCSDCHFIAHHLLTIDLEYRARLVANLADVFTLSDVVPLFCRMAEQSFKENLQVQQSELVRIMRKGNGFQGTDRADQYNKTKEMLTELVTALQQVALLWRPILPQWRWQQSIAHLLSAIVNAIIAQILAIPDLAVQETQALQRLLQHFLAALSSAISFPSTSLPESIPAFLKMKRLGDLMEMSLAATTQAWESGDLERSGFSREEVKILVEAIFTDTPLRAQSLRKIMTKRHEG